MMGANRFSVYRNEGGITLSGKTTPFRRVSHSASNWARAKTFHTSDKDLAKSIGKTVVTDGVAQVVSGTAIFQVAGLVTAGTAGAAAATFITGPLVAIGAGVVGLGFLAKGAYSNRDSAHEKLTPYVYSLIDDQAPAIDICTNREELKKAAVAAAYLMKEAPSQYKTMRSKLQTRAEAVQIFWKKYENVIAPLTGQGWNLIQKDMNTYNMTPPGSRTPEQINNLIEYHEYLNKVKVKSEEMLEKESRQGGAVFEYMRRLVKSGNYLQCAEIVSMATYAELGFKPNFQTVDPFKNWDSAVKLRKAIQQASDLQSEANMNYEKWEVFAKTNGAK